VELDLATPTAMTKPPSATIVNESSQRSFLRFAVACGIGLFVLFVIGGSRGQFGRLLVEFELPISPMTSWALGLVLPIVLALVVSATVAIELVAKRATTRNAWNATAICLALACLAAYIIGVALPLIQLIQGLS
jgi:hypothetical protein